MAAVDTQPMSTELRGVKRLRHSLSLSRRGSARVNRHKRTMTKAETLQTIPAISDGPEDFGGSVKVSQALPTRKELDSVANIQLVDRDGNRCSFKDLHSGPSATAKVLILFVRHFYCGNCQEYLRTFCTSITPSSLPPDSSVLVIGHGDPSLIPFYAEASMCPYPIYAEPTKAIFSGLGMTRTLNLGPKRPDYMQKSLLHISLASAMQMFAQGRNMFKGGDYWQVGGEFLFEADPRRGGASTVTWCHRMRTTRDHAEVSALRMVLGLDEKEDVKRKRWSLSGSGIVRNPSRKGQSSRSRSRNAEERRKSEESGSQRSSGRVEELAPVNEAAPDVQGKGV